MAAGFNPALNDAWIRFTFPAGMSLVACAWSIPDIAGRSDDEPLLSAAAAGSFRGAAGVRRAISSLTASRNL